MNNEKSYFGLYQFGGLIVVQFEFAVIIAHSGEYFALIAPFLLSLVYFSNRKIKMIWIQDKKYRCFVVSFALLVGLTSLVLIELSVLTMFCCAIYLSLYVVSYHKRLDREQSL